jgi:hypothetical protein
MPIVNRRRPPTDEILRRKAEARHRPGNDARILMEGFSEDARILGQC